VAKTRRGSEELPPDNAARIVLYDAIAGASETEDNFHALTEPELFEQVIPRLRVLVPRELHNLGQQQYFDAKLAACIDAGVLKFHPDRECALILGPTAPRIRYPDATIRDYTAGLEAARERLYADEDRLRRGGFEVRSILRSAANAKDSDRYRDLVASLREHGFLDCYPIINSNSDATVDGLARVAAAAEADVPLKAWTLPRHRDTPLQRALLALDLNAGRLQGGEVAEVHEAIAECAGRSWSEIERDLTLTRDWRRFKPKEYDARLEVDLVPFSGRVEPKVQITTDRTRVMLKSVLQEAGLPGWAWNNLRPYVAWEEARTQHSPGGNKPIFVRIDDAIKGISRMQRDRDRRGLKTDPAWEAISQWFESVHAPDGGETTVAAGT
jgi:hypothetical protein